MKFNKQFLFTLLAITVIAAVYRVLPGRPYGFAPQMAIGLFAGSLFVNDKKTAFALPLLSMFISDVLYQLLHMAGATEMVGFYSGQWFNYLLFVGLTVVGFYVKANSITGIIAGSIASPTLFYLISNTSVWLSGGGYNRPKTLEGYLQCMTDGLPFYGNGLLATFIFGAMLFGGYALLQRNKAVTV
ncbi:MAG: DUF6580 family putative transport protein [Chitinophagaceae bacterium]